MIEWVAMALPLLCAVAHAVKPTAVAARIALGALGAFGIWVAAGLGVALVQLRGQLGDHPADRATVYAVAIAESANCAALVAAVALVWAVPMFIGRRRRLGRP